MAAETGTCGVGEARLLAVFALIASATPSVRAQAQVAVVVRSEVDQQVAAQIAQLIEVPVREQHDAEVRSIGALFALPWPEQHVVVIDRQNDSVHVLRPGDKTLVSRVLDPGVMHDSPYAVALASAELLEWLGVLPAARGRPSQGEPGEPVPSPEEPARPRADAHEPEARSALGWAAGADLELATSPGFDVSLVRPSLSAELQIGRARDALWLAFGARVGAPASWARELPAERSTLRVEQVEYSDAHAALHAALGFGAGQASLLAQLEGGIVDTHVRARTAGDDVVGEHDGLAGLVGVGLALRYPLVSALALAAGVQGQWLLDRGRYRVDGAAVLEPGPIRVTTRIGLIWESGRFP